MTAAPTAGPPVRPDERPGADALGRARAALAGRREVALLEDPSVARAAAMLVARVRRPEPWVRALVGTLERFRAVTSGGDRADDAAGPVVGAADVPGRRLDRVLGEWRAEPARAARALATYAAHWPGAADTQLSALGFGPKVWLAANGVALPWRSLGGSTSATREAARGTGAAADGDTADRLLLVAVIGSGLSAREVLGLRLRDAGMLDARGEIVPDLRADPLAVRFLPDEGGPERIAFLSYDARVLVGRHLAAGSGADDPLVPVPPGSDVTGRAADRHAALIRAGNDVNVALCRATGDFFRSWGLPGARYRPSPE